MIILAYKILLPFDGSKCSLKAAEYVAQLMSSDKQVSCTAIFVMPFTRDMAKFLGMYDDEYDSRFRELTGSIEEKVIHIFRNKGLNVEILYREGDPVKVICNLAKQHDYSEIIMGSRGDTGFKKVINGNISQVVARKAICPVKIIM